MLPILKSITSTLELIMPEGNLQLRYAIFHPDDPTAPPLKVLQQCLQDLGISAVGFMTCLENVANRGVEHPDDIVLAFYVKPGGEWEDNRTAATEYIQRQIENWGEDDSMTGWCRFDQWGELKGFRHVD